MDWPINVIQIGDFGAGYDRDEVFFSKMDTLHEFLVDANVMLYVMRGNHDDPRFFNGDYLDRWSNMKFMPDYSILELEGKRILLMGGAVSIDRKRNKQGISYWVDEVFTLDVERLKGIKDIDLVATHTSPSFADPTDFNELVYSYAAYDNDLLRDLQFERALLDNAYAILKENNNPMEKWFYGHFHFKNVKMYENTEFNLLGIGEFYHYF